MYTRELRPFGAFWGKLRRAPDGAIEAWHPLDDHCLDVALTFDALSGVRGIRRSLDLAAGLPLQEVHIARLCVIAMLHDIGKFNIGFQAKAFPSTQSCGHVLEIRGLFDLDPLPQALEDAFVEMCAWFTERDVSLWSALLAAISHHGPPVSDNDLIAQTHRNPTQFWQPKGGLDPIAGVAALIQLARRTFPIAFTTHRPINLTPALQHRFAGLVMLADWIGSDTRYFPYRVDTDEDRVAIARAAARTALAEIGLQVEDARTDIRNRAPTFESIFGRTPYPLQRLLAETLPSNDTNRLVIMESETGSGKTEAALAWFFRLFSAGHVDGLYFALPTRVAARELYGRITKAVAAAFPDEATRPHPVLLAVPGYVRVDGNTPALPATTELWPDSELDRMRDRVWAAEHPKRFLAAPIAVGTIDQALLSGLQVRHAHLRSVCLDRQLLVVDEVHASDPYMRAILAELLEQHGRRGGWALLLSATLGEVARANLLNAPVRPVEESSAVPYPLVSCRTVGRPIPATGNLKAVHIQVIQSLTDDKALIPKIAEAIARGARVLIVRNVVARAINLLQEIENSGLIDPAAIFSVGGVPCPHHGRFARADREVLDRELSNRMGPNSPCGPLLVVGTQTLEQSLDIDADWIISDPCPMDVLLQRLGRLHRHARSTRPAGFEKPQALILAPPDLDCSRYIRHQGEGRGPAGLGTVYPDLRIVQRTLEILSSTPDVEFPRDNRALVESSLHPDALDVYSTQDWLTHKNWIEGTIIAEARQAQLSILLEEPFGECQYRAGADGPVFTRLGLNDRRVLLPESVASPFGQLIDELHLPGHLAPADSRADRALEVDIGREGFTFRVAERRYRYDRFGLQRVNGSEDA